ncbi:MAG: substrate-binding domain-containing protein [Lachnospiraceae bacterium]|nr:substrate-binding domain-containing protein [Lachnospiraceae bacterium]
MKKKLLSICMAAMMAVTVLTGCGGAESKAQDVYVISREDGSGTRGAFVELLGIEQKNEAGEKEDMTIDTAEVTNSTSVMITTVQGNEAGIGYISLGSMDDTKVKAIKVDGVEATVENVKNGSYKVARPFNIATMSGVSDAAQDFVNYILSTEGQSIVEAAGYIKLDDTVAYASNGATGKVVVGGSSSVSPVMEKIIESYAAVNAGVEIELQTSDSSTGMSATADGTLDIGMASRALKDSEIEKGLVGTQIAMDGIAVIVNKNNTAVDNLTSEQIMKIYTGEIKSWSEIQ